MFYFPTSILNIYIQKKKKKKKKKNKKVKASVHSCSKCTGTLSEKVLNIVLHEKKIINKILVL